MVLVTINDRSVEVSDDATILEAAQQAGVHIPTLCYHPRLPSHAVCRMCLVEIEGQQQLKPACVTRVEQGNKIITDSPELKAFRKTDAQWLLARHPNDCMRCEVNGSCQLQSLIAENQWEEQWPTLPLGCAEHPEHNLTDHTSPSIWRDLSKCIECGLCVEACGESGQKQHVIGFAERGADRMPVTVFDKSLAATPCISCGQCTLVCPVGALVETPHWHEVLSILGDRRQISVVQVAPATRIAISEEFGMKPGTVSTGRLINALRELGFDYVFDTNFAADLTIMEEASELLERLNNPTQSLPLFTSCCPGWINWLEINRPDLLTHLSTTKSPQQMHGALTKRGRFVESLGADFAEGKKEPIVVSVMPCTAKKDEAQRPDMAGDIDYVLTTRELARMIRARHISFSSLPDNGTFDSPLGESTGAAQIFGASGGVMEAMVRTASHFIDDDLSALEWQPLRGVNEGLKTAHIPSVGKVAICNGIASAQQLLESNDWQDDYVAIEVMACVGGCLGGGGEPKSLDPMILQKRAASIYEMDKGASRRRSYENTDVQQLYETELKQPNSKRAIELLHTKFAARNTKRLVLMKFLEYVDQRDGNSAAQLFHKNGEWRTNSKFGSVIGQDNISEFITNKLPPREFGAKFARHRMASASDPNDLSVVTPTGEHCRFYIEFTDRVASDNHLVIKSLTREVIAKDVS